MPRLISEISKSLARGEDASRWQAGKYSHVREKHVESKAGRDTLRAGKVRLE